MGFAAQGIQAEARARMTETIPRATLMRRAVVGGAALVAGGAAIAVLPRRRRLGALGRPGRRRSWRWPLTLEQAQLALYTAVEAAAFGVGRRAGLARFAKVKPRITRGST